MGNEETRNATEPYAPRVGDRPRTAVLIDAEAAAAEMRACGYEPLVPYPGRTNATWPSRCMTCGHEGRPTFSAVRNAGQRCRVCRARRPRRNAPRRTRRRPEKPCARPDSNRWNPTRAAKHRGGAVAPHAVAKPAPPTPTSTVVRGAAGSVPSTRQPTSARPPKCERPGSSRWSRTPAAPRTIGAAAVPAGPKSRRACPPSAWEPPAARSAPDPAAEPIPRQPPRRRAPPGSSRWSPIPGNHRPLALPLHVQHEHHTHPDQHQRRPHRVQNVPRGRNSITVGHNERR